MTRKQLKVKVFLRDSGRMIGAFETATHSQHEVIVGLDKYAAEIGDQAFLVRCEDWRGKGYWMVAGEAKK